MSENTDEQGKIPVPRKTVYVFFIMAFAAMAAMFGLGVMVGRGTLPVRYDIQGIEDELARMKAAVLRQEQAGKKPGEGTAIADLDIHKQLKETSDDLLFHAGQAPSQKTAASNAHALTRREAAPQPMAAQAAATSVTPAQAAPPEKQPVQEAAPPPKPAEEKAKPLTIQVAADTDEKEATALAEKWKKMGFSAYVTISREPGKKTIYRVRIGHFKTREEAQKVHSDVLKHKSDAFVLLEKEAETQKQGANQVQEAKPAKPDQAAKPAQAAKPDQADQEAKHKEEERKAAE